MARKIHSRYKINGTLIARSPIHVGGIGGNADTDLALAVNGEGEYYISGTSLAGALRAWMENLNGKITDFLWGFQDNNGDNGHASYVIVEDSVINSPIVEIRDGVAIDRQFGVASEGMKYDRAILPKGVKIPLQLTLERDANLDDQEWEKYQTLFAQLIAALKEGEIYLGAGKSRGLGKVKLDDENINIKKEDLSTPVGILQILKNEPNIDNDHWKKLYASHQQSQNKLDITITWEPKSCVMAKSEVEGMEVDILPLVSRDDNCLKFVISGSSVKGVWRSQAERILRTVCNITIPQDFEQQLQLELIEALFGAPAKSEDKPGYLSCIAIDDCYANINLTDSQWANIMYADTEQNLRSALALNNSGLNQTQQAYHVAIDRWTGGAADSFLYTVLEPMGVDWQPLQLTLNLQRLKTKSELYRPSIALFLLVLRDFMAAKIPIGFGTNRGMGAIKVTKVEIKAKGIDNDLSILNNTQLENFSAINTELLQSLEKDWQNWINSQG